MRRKPSVVALPLALQHLVLTLARPGSSGNRDNCPAVQLQQSMGKKDRSWMPACDPFTGTECDEREMQLVNDWMTKGSHSKATDALMELQEEFDQFASEWPVATKVEKLQEINILTKLLTGPDD